MRLDKANEWFTALFFTFEYLQIT